MIRRRYVFDKLTTSGFEVCHSEFVKDEWRIRRGGISVLSP